jgi:hypothetical protein
VRVVSFLFFFLINIIFLKKYFNFELPRSGNPTLWSAKPTINFKGEPTVPPPLQLGSLYLTLMVREEGLRGGIVGYPLQHKNKTFYNYS